MKTSARTLAFAALCLLAFAAPSAAADAPAAAPTGGALPGVPTADVWLDDLIPLPAGGGAKTAEPTKGAHADGEGLRLKNTTWQRGLAVRAPADIRYELKGDYAYFVALIGIDERVGNKGSAMARVFVDGVLVANSHYLLGGGKGWAVNVAIPAGPDGKPARQLRLVIDDGKDGPADDLVDIVQAGFRRRDASGWTPPAPKPTRDETFFNGKDLAGWKGTEKYWSVVDGTIIGEAKENVPRNEFLFSRVPAGDFYLSVRMKLEPNNGNSGIQFRSQSNRDGQAIGYQADVGAGWWGKLYHEHARGMLDATDAGGKHVKPGDWNQYEILAVGHRVWTAINGHLSTAKRDPIGELEGFIAFQMHSGPPMKVSFKDIVLIHNPEAKLAGLDEKKLDAALR